MDKSYKYNFTKVISENNATFGGNYLMCKDVLYNTFLYGLKYV